MLKDEFCTPWAPRCIILRGRGAAHTKPCISSWSPSLAARNFCHDVGCGLADFRRGATKAKDRCPAPGFSIYQYAKKITTQVTFPWKRNVPPVARGRVTQWKENTLYIIGHQLTLVLARKTKTEKTPCTWCKMSLARHWYCDWLRIPRASSGIFSQSQHHPIGFCIKRKAINRKNLLLWQSWNVPQEEWITAFRLQR